MNEYVDKTFSDDDFDIENFWRAMGKMLDACYESGEEEIVLLTPHKDWRLRISVEPRDPMERER